VGTEVGATLEFRIDSSATTSAGDKVPLRLSYLASYEHMGRARASLWSCHFPSAGGVMAKTMRAAPYSSVRQMVGGRLQPAI